MDAATAWLKGAHIVTLALWAGGLFALPLLLAVQPDLSERSAYLRLRAMSRFAYLALISPAAILAIVTGSALIPLADIEGSWLALKLTGVAGMALFHTLCGHFLSELRFEPGAYRPGLLKALVVVPLLLIAAVLWVILARPG